MIRHFSSIKAIWVLSVFVFPSFFWTAFAQESSQPGKVYERFESEIKELKLKLQNELNLNPPKPSPFESDDCKVEIVQQYRYFNQPPFLRLGQLFVHLGILSENESGRRFDNLWNSPFDLNLKKNFPDFSVEHFHGGIEKQALFQELNRIKSTYSFYRDEVSRLLAESKKLSDRFYSERHQFNEKEDERIAWMVSQNFFVIDQISRAYLQWVESDLSALLAQPLQHLLNSNDREKVMLGFDLKQEFDFFFRLQKLEPALVSAGLPRDPFADLLERGPLFAEFLSSDFADLASRSFREQSHAIFDRVCSLLPKASQEYQALENSAEGVNSETLSYQRDTLKLQRQIQKFSELSQNTAEILAVGLRDFLAEAVAYTEEERTEARNWKKAYNQASFGAIPFGHHEFFAPKRFEDLVAHYASDMKIREISNLDEEQTQFLLNWAKSLDDEAYRLNLILLNRALDFETYVIFNFPKAGSGRYFKEPFYFAQDSSESEFHQSLELFKKQDEIFQKQKEEFILALRAALTSL